MKIGFILKITDAGEREAFSLNKEKESVWAKYATDVRPYIKELKNFDGTKKVVILLRFFGINGYMIAIIKARPEGSGRAYDNTAAWIHIPSKIDLPTQKLYEIINTVEEEITSKYGINKARLQNLFSEEYSEKDFLFVATDTVMSSEHGLLAYRAYGRGTDYYTLQELLTDSVIAQAEYSNYRGVFLLDSTSGVCTDCTKLKETKPNYIILNPPVVNFEYKPFIKVSAIKKIPFSKPIEVPYKTELPIILCKNGYRDISKKLLASSNNEIRITLRQEECLRQIRHEWFRIFDTYTHDDLTSKARIIIDGNSFNNDSVLYVEETTDNLHEIDIECEGYKKYKKKIEIKTDNQIPLVVQEYEKEYTLPQEEGDGLLSDAIITIKTRKAYNKMPIKGYYSERGYLIRKKNIMERVKWFCLGFASLFILEALYLGYVRIDEFFDGHKFQLGWPIIVEKHIKTTTDDGEITPEPETEQPQATNLNDKAIEYLNRHEAWIKDSLENYEITKGLFDAMNAFELESLTSEKYSTLMQSDRFSIIFNAAQKCFEQNIDVKKGTIRGYYNSKPTDNKITINNYIQWLQNAPHEIGTGNNAMDGTGVSNQQDVDNSIDNESSQRTSNTRGNINKK